MPHSSSTSNHYPSSDKIDNFAFSVIISAGPPATKQLGAVRLLEMIEMGSVEMRANGKFRDQPRGCGSKLAKGLGGHGVVPPVPGPLAPARELYGEMLLDRGMAKEGLAAFEATQAKEPNRLRGFLGAAQAAEKLGDKTAAKANYEKLRAHGWLEL